MVNEKRKKEILKAVTSFDNPKQSDVASSIGVSQGTLSPQVSELVERGLIRKEKQGRANVLYLTQEGVKECPKSQDEPHPSSSSGQSVNTDGKQQDGATSKRERLWSLRAHNCSVRAELSDNLPLLSKWFESWMESRDKSFQKTDDGYITQLDGFKCRFTKNYVIVFLPEEVGDDVVEVKNRVFQRARDRLDRVVSQSPAEIKESSIDPRFSLRRQELALMDDPFAEACVSSDDVDLREQNYRDKDGELRFHIDYSNGVPELEFVNTDLGEEDATFYREEHIGRILENKEDYEKLLDREIDGDLDKVEELIHLLTRLITLDKLDSIGLSERKKSAKVCECCERQTKQSNEDSKESQSVSEESGNSQKESINERLKELQDKMNERREKWKEK